MPAKSQVFGLINHTHATSPKFAEDTVVGYLLADHKSAGRCPGDNRGNVRPLSDSGQLPCSVFDRKQSPPRASALFSSLGNQDTAFPKMAAATTFRWMPHAAEWFGRTSID